MAMTPVSGRPAPPDLREDARVGKPIENGRISNNMTDPWPAVIGTLSGVLITAATALLTQALQARRVRDGEMRTARREVYAKYLSAANAYLQGLADFSWSIRKGSRELAHERAERSTMLAAELRTLRAPLEILTTSARMREAVEAVERCLEEIAGTLYDANRKYDSEPSLARNLLRQEGWYEKFRGPVEGYIEAAQGTDPVIDAESVISVRCGGGRPSRAQPDPSGTSARRRAPGR
jgi:uncharacterized protein YukE